VLGILIAMPSPIVEQVRAVYAEWARGNFRGGEDLVADEVTFITFTGEGDRLTFQGPSAVRDWMRDFLRTWTDLRVEAHEFVERGDRVLAVCHQRAKGRQSGVEVEMPVYTVWTFRDDKARRIHWTRDRDEAFSEAGVDPPP
jgi:ketosteroid isomerase-like protein